MAESAEKLLLKAIENTPDQAGTSDAGNKDAAVRRDNVVLTRTMPVGAGGFRMPSLPFAFKNPLAGGPDSLKAFFNPARFKHFEIRDVNIVLIIAIVIAMLSLFNSYAQGSQLIHSKLVFTPDKMAAITSPFDVKSLSPLKEISFYVKKVNERNLFDRVEKVIQQVTVEAEKPKINQMVEGIKLVGISWDDDPTAISIMLEDTKKTLTYFLKEGDTISNLTVKKIYKDKVVLSYKNEEYELR